MTRSGFPGLRHSCQLLGDTHSPAATRLGGSRAVSHPSLRLRTCSIAKRTLAMLFVLLLVNPAYGDVELWISEQGEIWPTLVEIDLCNAAGNTLPVRFFNRHYATVEWIADQDSDGDGTPERQWRVSRHDSSPEAGEWHLYRDDELVATFLHDLWWLQPRVDWVSSAGPSGTFEALDFSIDWGRIDVVYIPVFYGFLVGLMADWTLGIIGFTCRGLLRPVRSIEFM